MPAARPAGAAHPCGCSGHALQLPNLAMTSKAAMRAGWPCQLERPPFAVHRASAGAKRFRWTATAQRLPGTIQPLAPRQTRPRWYARTLVWLCLRLCLCMCLLEMSTLLITLLCMSCVSLLPSPPYSFVDGRNSGGRHSPASCASISWRSSLASSPSPKATSSPFSTRCSYWRKIARVPPFALTCASVSVQVSASARVLFCSH